MFQERCFYVPVGSIEHFDLIVHPGDAVNVKN